MTADRAKNLLTCYIYQDLQVSGNANYVSEILHHIGATNEELVELGFPELQVENYTYEIGMQLTMPDDSVYRTCKQTFNCLFVADKTFKSNHAMNYIARIDNQTKEKLFWDFSAGAWKPDNRPEFQA